MNTSMKLAVVGARQSGKTTMSLALSHLCGLPRVHARTIKSFADDLFPGSDLSALQSHQLLSLGLARYTDRTVRESEAEQGFVSDGSVLNELIYGSVRIRMAKEFAGVVKKLLAGTVYLPAKTLGKRIYNEYAYCLKYHAKTTYDAFLYLDWAECQPASLSDRERQFRKMYDDMLLQCIDEIGIPCYKLHGDKTQRLEQVMSRLALNQAVPTSTALEAAEADEKSLDVEYHYA